MPRCSPLVAASAVRLADPHEDAAPVRLRDAAPNVRPFSEFRRWILESIRGARTFEVAHLTDHSYPGTDAPWC